MKNNIVTITGDLGSGKSTVSKKLADTLRARRYSAGTIQRGFAKSKSISTLELNQRSSPVFAGKVVEGSGFWVG